MDEQIETVQELRRDLLARFASSPDGSAMQLVDAFNLTAPESQRITPADLNQQIGER